MFEAKEAEYKAALAASQQEVEQLNGAMVILQDLLQENGVADVVLEQADPEHLDEDHEVNDGQDDDDLVLRGLEIVTARLGLQAGGSGCEGSDGGGPRVAVNSAPLAAEVSAVGGPRVAGADSSLLSPAAAPGSQSETEQHP